MAALMRKAARRTLVEFFQKTSLNGFGLLYHIRKRRFQRLFWFMFIAVGILFASYVVLKTLLEFLVHPTVTVLSSLGLAIDRTPLPSIAICPANQLSRRAVLEYAEQLSSGNGSAVQHWLQRLLLLNGHFDPLAVPAEAAVELQLALGSQWPADSRSQLLRLSKSCESLLLRCRLAGIDRNCADLFQLAASGIGCCCFYNYKENKHNKAKAVQRLKHSGQQLGLDLWLNASRLDDLGGRRVSGFAVHIFPADGSAPEQGTGALRTLHLAPGEAAAVELRPVVEEADLEVAGGGCLLASLAEPQAQCLSQCRLRLIIASCHCQPFSHRESESSANASQCSLAQIECRQRQAASWSPDLPQCLHCQPLCSGVRYDYRKSWRRLPQPSGNRSELILYYSRNQVPLYRQNELYNWYQILSNIGGVIGICIGCSFISGFEIIYFLLYRLWDHFQQLRSGN